MDTNQTSLQTRFPLDIKKKFWKKMCGEIIGGLLLSAFIALAPTFTGLIFLVKNNTNIPTHDALVSLLASFLIWMLSFFIIRSLIYAWYWKAYIARYYYSADENFLTIKKGVFSPTEIHVQYQKIQDVYVDQDYIDRLFFGLYDVHIASATVSSGIEAHVDGLNKENAEGLKNFLLNSIKIGGTQNASAAATVQAPTQQVVKFSTAEEISNQKYPFSKEWYWVSIIGSSLKALVFVSFAVLYVYFDLYAKTQHETNLSPAVYYGFVALNVLALLWGIIKFVIWTKNYMFKFNEDYIYYKDGVISMTEKHMPYSSVQDVIVSQSIFGRILGYSNVTIQNASQSQTVGRGSMMTNSANVVLQGLPTQDAQKISEVLRNTVLSKNNRGANGL